jgi:molybdopterin synthase sulfur carrier subunit
MKVYIPTPLRSYTRAQHVVEGNGATLSEILYDLDKQFPGIRFRMINEQDQIREHIKVFVNDDLTKQLSTAVQPGEKIHIICALSGG